MIEILHLCEKKKFCGSGDKIDEDGDDEVKEEDKVYSGCGNAQPKFRKGTGVKIEIEFPERNDSSGEDRKQYLSALRVHEIFKRISETDCAVLGFDTKYSPPDWLLIQVLPVSPPAVRPFVLMDGMRPSQDDLTHKVYDIMKTNNALKRYVCSFLCCVWL